MSTDDYAWIKEFAGSVIVSDPAGIITGMNDKGAKTLEEDGGRAMIGKNMLECHPEPARSKLAELMQKRQTNIYTIEKKGLKKLIYQSPWYQNGEYAGFIEISLEIPFDMPHFVRS
jgi:transcriptional regulator with PAS, ATPase and Fis domain